MRAVRRTPGRPRSRPRHADLARQRVTEPEPDRRGAKTRVAAPRCTAARPPSTGGAAPLRRPRAREWPSMAVEQIVDRADRASGLVEFEMQFGAVGHHLGGAHGETQRANAVYHQTAAPAALGRRTTMNIRAAMRQIGDANRVRRRRARQRDPRGEIDRHTCFMPAVDVVGSRADDARQDVPKSDHRRGERLKTLADLPGPRFRLDGLGRHARDPCRDFASRRGRLRDSAGDFLGRGPLLLHRVAIAVAI